MSELRGNFKRIKKTRDLELCLSDHTVVAIQLLNYTNGTQLSFSYLPSYLPIV